MSILVRTAREDDWPSIYPFFRATVEAGRTYAYPPNLTSQDAKSLWLEPPPWRSTVAVADGRIVGSAKMGPNRPGRGSHIATASFMVDPNHRGGGVGRTLASDMVAWARAQGYRGIQFNAVVETNHAAVHLWTSLGFRVVGTVPEAFDHAEHGLVGLHVMYLPLDGPTPASTSRSPTGA